MGFEVFTEDKQQRNKKGVQNPEGFGFAVFAPQPKVSKDTKPRLGMGDLKLLDRDSVAKLTPEVMESIRRAHPAPVRKTYSDQWIEGVSTPERHDPNYTPPDWLPDFLNPIATKWHDYRLQGNEIYNKLYGPEMEAATAASVQDITKPLPEVLQRPTQSAIQGSMLLNQPDFKTDTGSTAGNVASDVVGGIAPFLFGAPRAIFSKGARLAEGLIPNAPALVKSSAGIIGGTAAYEGANDYYHDQAPNLANMGQAAASNVLLSLLTHGAVKAVPGVQGMINGLLPSSTPKIEGLNLSKPVKWEGPLTPFRGTRSGAMEPITVPKVTHEDIRAGLQQEVGLTSDLAPGQRLSSIRVPEKMEELSNGQRVRSLGVSAAKSDWVSPELRNDLINDMVPEGRGAYNVHSNKDTIEWANRIINSNNVKEAERFVRENPGTDLSNTVALKLIQNANKEGRYEDATDLIQLVSENATSQGQAIQSLRLWGKMTPEGMQRYYTKTIKNTNRDIEKKAGKMAEKVQVKPEIMAEIKSKMEDIGAMEEGRQKDIAIAKVLDLIASQVPIPFSRKLASIQTMAQLLNPKTAIRNIVGNFGFAGLENVSDVVGAGLDKGLSLITKERTKVLPSLTTQLKGGKEGFKLGLEDALVGIDTSGIGNKFDLPKGKVFRSGLLGAAEKALNIELRATDRAFYQAAYDESLRNQMLAAKVSKPTEQMEKIAHLDGLYRTFQDENVLSNLFSGIKRLLNANKEFGVGDFTIKYPKTPANLLMRGIDYSPTGFVKVLFEISKPLTKKQFNQREFVNSFSRALVGSINLLGTGILLHKLGVITSKPVDDLDLAELNRQSGFGDYRINVSALKRLMFNGGDLKPQKRDIIVSYDWFQPQAIPLAIGADIDAHDGKAKGIAGTLLQAFETGVNAFADQPVMQGFETLFSGGKGNITAGIGRILEGVPASFVPTLLNQIKQLTDNQRKETYSPNVIEESLNRTKNKIPGLSSNLPQKYGTLGQPLETYQDKGNNSFNVFLNPAFVNEYNPSPEMQRINDIFNLTGETTHIPRVAPKSITVDKQKFIFTGSERAKYQKILGEKTLEEFAKVPKKLSPEEEQKILVKALGNATEKAKIEILKEKGIKVYKGSHGLKIGK
ncbi:hypothetical protein V6C32_14715 [Desulforamulus ruminis]|uniref:hypothetical protein n=1 Tax=Desulforamulus ruminis TaxID=1564 RepID=UPI002FD89F46